ncbi:MAG: hypothetical protein HY812_06895 [Planctomycetes bacterium]|nr:hypothetical protein [Planctomycetota bacterium]
MSRGPLVLPLLFALVAFAPSQALAGGYKAGHVFVVSEGAQELLEFDRKGVFVGKVGDLYVGPPHTPAFDPDGLLWMIRGGSLPGEPGLVAYDSSWVQVRDIPLAYEPGGLWMGPGGTLWVTSPADDVVYIFGRTGVALGNAANDATLFAPRHGALSVDGHVLLFANQGATQTFHAFDEAGLLEKTVTGYFRATAILPDADGRYLVADWDDWSVHVFGPDYAELASAKIANAAVLRNASGIAFAMDGALLASSYTQHQVARFPDPSLQGADGEVFTSASPLQSPRALVVAPKRLQVRVRGTLLESSVRTKVDENAVLSILPHTPQAMLSFKYSGEIASRLGDAFVLQGFQDPDWGTGPVRFHGTQRPAYSNAFTHFGFASIGLEIDVKRNAAGRIQDVEKASGSFHAANQDVVFHCTVETVKALN